MTIVLESVSVNPSNTRSDNNSKNNRKANSHQTLYNHTYLQG